MTIYSADLHVHTLLSPCAEVEMIPPLIVARAIEVGLDMIAVTDHNSAENVEAVIEAAQGTSLRVIPGIECESLEGVHIVCLFDNVSDALYMQDLIYARLPDMPNRADIFGAQFVVDAEGEFIRYNDRLLLASTELTIDQIVNEVESLGGFAFPAHVDRQSYGIYGVLGFLPEEPIFPAVEISRHLTPETALDKYPDLRGKILFRSSDAHRLEELGSGRTMLDLPHRTVGEIREMVRRS